MGLMAGAPIDVRTAARDLAALQLRWATIAPTTRNPVDPVRLEALRTEERSLRAQGRWVAGHSTLIEVLGLERDEVRNCQVLRWLLDPMAPHGYGADALHLVLDRLNGLTVRRGLAPQEYPGAELATLVVEETRGNTRADLVVNGQSWTVVFEAKIDAGEQPAQGRRLSELWPNATYVFLTRRGTEMHTTGEDPWIPMRWSDVLGAVRSAAALRADGAPVGPGVDRARRAVADYLHGARRLTA